MITGFLSLISFSLLIFLHYLIGQPELWSYDQGFTKLLYYSKSYLDNTYMKISVPSTRILMTSVFPIGEVEKHHQRNYTYFSNWIKQMASGALEFQFFMFEKMRKFERATFLNLEFFYPFLLLESENCSTLLILCLPL